MLDPRRLLTFREVARQGSFSRAADALALSQPAVSQQVGALERELGATLLVRGRAGTVVTPAGELLLAHADALAARLDLAGAQMDELAAGERATLRVGSFPSALATVVPAAVAALREVPLRDLSGETWMAPEPEGSLVDACRTAGFEPRVAIVSRDPLAARAIVAAGLAVSLTPSLLADLELPGIVTRPLRGVAPRRALYAVAPAQGAHPLARGLIDELAVALSPRRAARPRRT